MAGHLSKANLALVEQFIEADVFQDMDRHRIDFEGGLILGTCPDGHRFPDIFDHQRKMMKEAGIEEPVIHPLSWHGGAIRCAPCSPANKGKHDHKIFLGEVRFAIERVGIYTIALLSHAPCGLAGFYGIDIKTQIALHMRAKQMVRALEKDLPVPKKLNIIPCFNVDYGGERKKKTYFLCKTKWAAWADEHGVKAIC